MIKARSLMNICIWASVTSGSSVGLNFSGTFMIHMTEPLLTPHSFSVFRELSSVSYFRFMGLVW